jgi:hypothetical protein
MPALPDDGFALVLLVFVLGVKHGFDADHLATIDGLTRFNARRNPAGRAFAAACSPSATARWWWPSRWR